MKNLTYRRWFILCLVVVLLLPTVVWGAEVDEIQKTLEVEQKKYLEAISSDFISLPDVLGGRSLVDTDEAGIKILETLPEKFDLREQGVVTPVKLQNPWGTCWAHGIIGASEISLMSELGLNIHNGDEPIDLSELHLAWFVYTPLSSGIQKGEGIYLVKPELTEAQTKLDNGAWPFSGTSILSTGIGPVPESVAPYKNKEGYSYEGDDWYYTKGGDWSVPESLRFNAVYELEETKKLASPVGYRYDEDESATQGYVHNEVATQAMKEELMAGRGVEICYTITMQVYVEGNELIISGCNPDTWAHYTWSDFGHHAPHGVTIVGWDDNYSKENFLPPDETLGRSQPPEDGAWIVKNSWGSLDRPAPHKLDWGDNGYFYLSYYDKSISSVETYNYDTTQNDSPYFFNHSYDYLPVTQTSTISHEQPTSMANVFVAEEDQIIKKVGTDTGDENIDVVYEIYKLNPNHTSPIDGTLMGRLEKNYPNAGFHRNDLEKGIYIEEGESFSVVTTQKSDDVYHTTISNTSNERSVKDLGGTSYGKGIVNAGESYLNEGNEWKDYKDVTSQWQSESEMGKYFDYDNFAISAYGYPVKIYPIIEGDEQNIVGNKDATFKIEGNIKDFEELTLNEEIVSPEYYTIEAGSIILTLKSEYLQNLPKGSHHFKANMNNGYAMLNLTLTKDEQEKSGNGKEKNPKTGVEERNIEELVMLMAIIAGAIGIVGSKKEMHK